MSCYTKDVCLSFTLWLVIIFMGILPPNIIAQESPANLCAAKTSNTKYFSFKHLNNDGTCIWEVTSTEEHCVDQLDSREGVIQVVQTPTSCVLCHDNQTCNIGEGDSHAFCGSDSTCHCEHGYLMSSGSGSSQIRCLEANVLLGGFCKESQQCSSGNSGSVGCVAGSNICDCTPGLIPSDDLTKCLPIVNELASTKCEEDAQCKLGIPGSLSECALNNAGGVDSDSRSKVCNCIAGRAVNKAGGHVCWEIARHVGVSCSIHAQCTVGLRHSRCVEGRCDCIKGYKASLVDLLERKWICRLE